MRVGLIGNRFSGKTAIFNLLTNQLKNRFKKDGAVLATVDVADERVNYLSNIYKPKKTIFAKMEFADFTDFDTGLSNNKQLIPSSMAKIRTIDALALVVDNFSHKQNAQEIKSFINIYKAELLLSDLILAENRVKNIEQNLKKGKKEKSDLNEVETLTKLITGLQEETPISEMTLTDNETIAIKGIQFFTKKPFFTIVNSTEQTYGKLDLTKNDPLSNILEVAAIYELELLSLDDEDRISFLTDVGIDTQALERLTTLLYKTLGYNTFFTVGSDEVRAWTIKDGTFAKKAAGKIHSDIERGFIRAECFNFEDLKKFGSEKKLKENKIIRLEGKNYPVKDGDIMNFRFNV